MGDYAEFIASKFVAAEPAGFEWPRGRLPRAMMPWQRKVALWALRRGRCALFLDTGLGKTLVSLAWGSAVARHTGKPVLYFCPLAVGPQTVREAEKFKVKGVALAESQADVAGPGVYVSNYQKLHLFDPAAFGGVILGESSILKSFTGATKRQLCEAFRHTPYRLCETATPAPNDHMELGNHSAFLGVMDADEMLTRWFVNDQARAGNYRLKGHAAADYWRWVASWACCVSKPSDLGYPDDGYDLPPLTVTEHVVEADLSSDDALFRSEKLSATTLHREKRRSAAGRAARVAELVRSSPGPWLVWCDADYEADELTAAIPDAVEVRGSMPDKVKEDRLLGFADGRYRVIVTKSRIAGFGLNWQHCRQMAFVGVSYSWESFYQSVRRCWRFGQEHPVEAHVVLAEGEHQVLAEVKWKQADNDAMRAAMVGAVREHWQADQGERALVKTYEPHVESGGGWTMRLGDCVQEAKAIPDATVGFSIHSPPFSNLYIYSDSAFDMGNAADHGEFFRHYGYLVPELLRVTVPGRLAAVHCKDLPLYRNRDGAAGLYDFPGEICRLFTSHGWTFHSRVTIWKCPVTEMERTKNNGLLHRTVKRDSSQARQGMADYLLVFRKNPEGDNLSAEPVERPDGFKNWPGDPAMDPRKNDWHPSKYARRKAARSDADDGSIAVWQRLADPVWFHVDQRDVLNYEIGKADRDEKHICPLQLGVVREAVYLWTNPGDLVFDPFNGIGSTGVEALALGRRYLGIELKRSYFDVAVRNLERAAEKARQKDLFAGVA